MYLVQEKHAVQSGSRPLSAVEAGLDQLEPVYAFIYARVGNRADAEDLTQQVAVKALHRLRESASDASIRAYLFATARSVLAAFWSDRFRLPLAELPDELSDASRGAAVEAPREAADWLNRTLARLPVNYRTVLELRFLQSLSLKEAAVEMGKSVGAIKLMQMRALQTAARLGEPVAVTAMTTRSRPVHLQS